MARVLHFELAAEDPKRAATFYKDVFGWNINKWDGPVEYWLAETGKEGTPGINGALNPRSQQKEDTIVTIEIDNIEETLEALKKAGGKVLMEIMEIPGIGRFTYCLDTEGVKIGVMEPVK